MRPQGKVSKKKTGQRQGQPLLCKEKRKRREGDLRDVLAEAGGRRGREPARCSGEWEQLRNV